MIRSSLRRRAAAMGTLAAAGAGALTAGLVSGIGHLAADTTTKTTGTTGTAPAGRATPTTRTPTAAATSTPSRTKRHRTTRTRTSSDTGGGNVAPAPPNSPPQGGSNGS